MPHRRQMRAGPAAMVVIVETLLSFGASNAAAHPGSPPGVNGPQTCFPIDSGVDWCITCGWKVAAKTIQGSTRREAPSLTGRPEAGCHVQHTTQVPSTHIIPRLFVWYFLRYRFMVLDRSQLVCASRTRVSLAPAEGYEREGLAHVDCKMRTSTARPK